VGTVDTHIARKQNSFLGEPGDGVTMGMSNSQMVQFHAVFPVIEEQFVREKHRGWFKATRLHVGSFFGGLFPATWFSAVETRFIALHLLNDARVCQRSGSIFHPNPVAIKVIPMVMGVKGETNRFVSKGPNLGKDLLGTQWKVSVNDQNVIFKDDPSVVREASRYIPHMEVDLGGDAVHLPHITSVGR
jgi:hypothetical protein